MAKEPGSKRLNLLVTPETWGYLEQLARIGVHGKSVPDVTRTLVARELERLILAGLVKVPGRDPRPGQQP